MYQYTAFDQKLVDERVAQFRDQTERRLSGELSEDEYRPLRLQNGLYVQKHAPMLRVAIPYGLLASRHLRMSSSVDRVRVRLRPRPRVRRWHYVRGGFAVSQPAPPSAPTTAPT